MPQELRSALCIGTALGLPLLSGCGPASPPPAAPSAEAPTPSAASASDAAERRADGDGDSDASGGPKALPTACASPGDEYCTPPIAFVKRLCGGFYPDVALGMFVKGTPWTRGYLNRNVVAWNASGGAASTDKLVFDEEVIVLHRRAAATGGMQISGAGDTYDVIRWDGTCASLVSEELTLRPPPKAKHARIPWKSLAFQTREALLGDGTIDKTDADRRKECKGATMGGVSRKCIEADAQLSAVIVEYVRRGGPVPAPDKLP